MVVGQPAPFGELLRRYREAAGFSQEELAERTGLSKNAIGTLERGERRRPYPDTLRRLADALRLSAADRARLAAARPGGDGTPPGSAPSAGPRGHATPALPGPVEPLIGREREGEELLHLLVQPEVRLLTLTGPGGVGKTRLAIEVAQRALCRFPDGAAFVSLAPLQDPALIIPTVARALGLREAGRQKPREILRGYLRNKVMLLVLDNWEHLLPAAPDVVELLLACPLLTLLATSRAPLRLRGEQEYPVPPLGLPNLARVPPFEDVARAASVQLFVRRARQVSPAFALAPSNALSIAAICRRLDGLPLAIELGAARVKLLPPAELLARLDRALPLLTGGARDLPARQRTLQDTIAWSYDLLGPVEQALFRRLAVFAGGCMLDATEAVCGADLDVLEGLVALVDQSLLRSEATGDRDGQPRFAMLETIREYALERLEENGEADALRRRHAEYFLGLAEGWQRAHRGVGQPVATLREWMGRLVAELANLRAAMAWALERDADLALRLCGALANFWRPYASYAEGDRWLGRALALPGAPERPAYADALFNDAIRRWVQGDVADARPRLEQVVAFLRGKPGHERHQALLGRALGYLAAVTIAEESLDAAAGLAGESRALLRAAGDEAGLGEVLLALGAAHTHRGEDAAACPLLEECLALWRRLGNGSAIMLVTNVLGDALRIKGDAAGAARLYEESLELTGELGTRGERPGLLHSLGHAVLTQGESGRARGLFAESLALALDLEDHGGVAEGLAGFAAMAAAEGHGPRAARLLAAATAVWEGQRLRLWTAERAEYERTLARARAGVDEATWRLAWDEGRAMGSGCAVEYALGELVDA